VEGSRHLSDVAWWIDRSTYRRLRLIGPDGPNRIGNGSHGILAAICAASSAPGGARRRPIASGICIAVCQPQFCCCCHLDTTRSILRHWRPSVAAARPLVSKPRGDRAMATGEVAGFGVAYVDIDCSRSAAGQAKPSLAAMTSIERSWSTRCNTRLGCGPTDLAIDVSPPVSARFKARQTVVDLAKTLSLLVRKSEASKLGMVARSGLSIALSTAHRLARTCHHDRATAPIGSRRWRGPYCGAGCSGLGFETALEENCDGPPDFLHARLSRCTRAALTV